MSTLLFYLIIFEDETEEKLSVVGFQGGYDEKKEKGIHGEHLCFYVVT